MGYSFLSPWSNCLQLYQMSLRWGTQVLLHCSLHPKGFSWDRSSRGTQNLGSLSHRHPWKDKGKQSVFHPLVLSQSLDFYRMVFFQYIHHSVYHHPHLVAYVDLSCWFEVASCKESLFVISKQVGCDCLNLSQLIGQNDHLTDYYCHHRFFKKFLPHYLILDDFS